MQKEEYSPTKIEIERRNRIRVSVAAYAYEYTGHTIMSDSEFDDLCFDIDPSIDTGHEVLDEFFRTEFCDYTGSWIAAHPELEKVKACYERVYINHN